MGVQAMTADLTASQRLRAESMHMSVEVRIAADKIDELETENEKLRESLAEAEHSESMAWDRTSKVKAENAKLRELLSEMLGSCCKYHSCDWECKHSYRDRKERCRLRDRARELGIDNDDDSPMSDDARRVFERLMSELGGDSDESR